MADERLSDGDATVGTDIADGDQWPFIDVSRVVDHASGSNATALTTELIIALQRRGMNRVKRLDSQHSISSTTGTEVTGLTMALEAGTYVFEYYLIVRSATGTVGPMMGVNFDGTAAVKTMIAHWADATTVITAEVHAMDDQGILGAGFISGMANKAYTTTAPNMGTTIGVSTTASDIPMFIKGVIIVTVAGNLELWHSSETATATSVEVGSSLVVVRTDLDPT